MNKIDPHLLKKVSALGNNQQYECVLYANNYRNLSNYLKESFEDVREIPFINAFVLNLGYDSLFKLCKLNAVKYITQSAKVSALVNVANKILHTENKADIPSANFSIAVIDTGIYPHLDFMVPHNKIIKFVDLVNNRDIPYDDNGHGTFVSGVIAGNGTVDSRYIGIDPFSNIIAIKALDQNGETSASNILTAMQWVYDHKNEFNIKVVCMSFGSLPLGKNDPLMMGAEMLWDNGIVVVSAAGNSGPNAETIRSPGSSHKIITVGALNDHRIKNDPQYNLFSVAEFSSRGPIFNTYKPDLIISGVGINGLNYNVDHDFYTNMSGTSVSTPMVVGIVSIIIKKYPQFSPDQVKKYLISCCTKITGDRNSEGFGWLDGKKLFKDLE